MFALLWKTRFKEAVVGIDGALEYCQAQSDRDAAAEFFRALVSKVKFMSRVFDFKLLEWKEVLAGYEVTFGWRGGVFVAHCATLGGLVGESRQLARLMHDTARLCDEARSKRQKPCAPPAPAPIINEEAPADSR